MTLAEKYNEFARDLSRIYLASGLTSDLITFAAFSKAMQRAFYAGAAAVMFEDVSTDEQMRAEIDHFRSHK